MSISLFDRATARDLGSYFSRMARSAAGSPSRRALQGGPLAPPGSDVHAATRVCRVGCLRSSPLGSFGHALDEHPRLPVPLGSSRCAPRLVTRDTGARCRVQARPSRGHSQLVLRGVCICTRGLPRPSRRASASADVGSSARRAGDLHPHTWAPATIAPDICARPRGRQAPPGRTPFNGASDGSVRRAAQPCPSDRSHGSVQGEICARSSQHRGCPHVLTHAPCATRTVVDVNGRGYPARHVRLST